MSIIEHIAPDPSVIDPRSIASTCVEQMERAWNSADGDAFGTVFADETDFVNILGEHHRGNGAILGQAHQAIFDSIYAGSTIHYRLDVARMVAQGCVIAVVTSTLNAPTGPLEGTNQSRFTATIVEHNGRWSIAAFQNTLVR